MNGDGMGIKIIGKCSLCGGKVTIPDVWWGIYPPDETCSSCGAVSDRLPEIKMKRINPIDADKLLTKNDLTT